MIPLLAHTPFVRALLVALVHFVWQGFVIGAALWFVLAILPKRHAEARHAAACTALLLMAIAPTTTFCLVYAEAPEIALGVPLALNAEMVARPPSTAEWVMATLFLCWLVGVSFMSLRLFGGLWRLQALIEKHGIPFDSLRALRFDELSRRMGITRPIRYLQSYFVDVPMTIGWLRPVVLIPCSVLSSLPPLQLDAIVAHELAHIRRYDYVVNILQSVLEALLFYHPCVFWASNRIRAERECCCDDAAIALGYDPLGYARALTELEGLRTRNPLPALASTGGSLMNRIKRIVQPTPTPRDTTRTLLAPILVLGAVTAFSVAGLAACGAAKGDSAKPGAPIATQMTQSIGIRWLPPVLDPWKPLILAAAAKHNVDPEVLAIMMLVESSGDPNAKSPAGAVGLLQIMPKTGEAIAKERNLTDFTTDKLAEPETNVDFGAWYLARQVDTFGKDKAPAEKVELAAAAYNGGTERLREYLAGNKPLTEETTRYKSLVAGMWSERGADESTTYRQWRERVRTRSAERAATPVTGARVTMAYGDATNPFSGKQEKHVGVDLAIDAGTPVVAPLGGKIRSAAAEGERGNAVVIDHGNGLETRFHHLGEMNVAPGQSIAKGDKIGTVGSTGKSTGPHVHFEVRDFGEPIDPTGYVKTNPPAP
ncbi:MAG TPA: peptidoglycan DD-metalloendopeptidase family protein [Polyangium sp.]|nr:peptidoglycan DD-metalloendopeptidase family protein [Polyangium sp.]